MIRSPTVPVVIGAKAAAPFRTCCCLVIGGVKEREASPASDEDHRDITLDGGGDHAVAGVSALTVHDDHRLVAAGRKYAGHLLREEASSALDDRDLVTCEVGGSRHRVATGIGYANKDRRPADRLGLLLRGVGARLGKEGAIFEGYRKSVGVEVLVGADDEVEAICAKLQS
ncbi:MAG: hypothetical protein OHK0015_15070 [Chloroflexi bacterium OHK40]